MPCNAAVYYPYSLVFMHCSLCCKCSAFNITVTSRRRDCSEYANTEVAENGIVGVGELVAFNRRTLRSAKDRVEPELGPNKTDTLTSRLAVGLKPIWQSSWALSHRCRRQVCDSHDCPCVLSDPNRRACRAYARCRQPPSVAACASTFHD